MEALLTNVEAPLLNKSSLVIECGATHHMFQDKGVFTKLDLNLNRQTTTSAPKNLCHKPITITRNNSAFHLSQNNSTILSGQIINKLMIVTFNQPVSLLTKHSHNAPWHH
ncbi:hypothetical protein O181_057763 [Austropuccinia psidii MF-1]|uniref:Uncharacterized protein n=1 Tax=Austropuccinia psidii MF-1 TaxID=1389203 RepID=A0A9Q3HUT8_9BASI|nr:hypothetical protein [Austropuccinia psidii MF-1]